MGMQPTVVDDVDGLRSGLCGAALVRCLDRTDGVEVGPGLVFLRLSNALLDGVRGGLVWEALIIARAVRLDDAEHSAEVGYQEWLTKRETGGNGGRVVRPAAETEALLTLLALAQADPSEILVGDALDTASAREPILAPRDAIDGIAAGSYGPVTVSCSDLESATRVGPGYIWLDGVGPLLTGDEGKLLHADLVAASFRPIQKSAYLTCPWVSARMKEGNRIRRSDQEIAAIRALLERFSALRPVEDGLRVALALPEGRYGLLTVRHHEETSEYEVIANGLFSRVEALPGARDVRQTVLADGGDDAVAMPGVHAWLVPARAEPHLRALLDDAVAAAERRHAPAACNLSAARGEEYAERCAQAGVPHSVWLGVRGAEEYAASVHVGHFRPVVSLIAPGDAPHFGLLADVLAHEGVLSGIRPVPNSRNLVALDLTERSDPELVRATVENAATVIAAVAEEEAQARLAERQAEVARSSTAMLVWIGDVPLRVCALVPSASESSVRVVLHPMTPYNTARVRRMRGLTEAFAFCGSLDSNRATDMVTWGDSCGWDSRSWRTAA